MFDKLWEESPTIQKMREQFRDQYYEEGMKKGMKKGIKEGMKEGIMQGVQRTLVDVVKVRFPDLTDLAKNQVKCCNNPDTLESFFQQILTAPDPTTAKQVLESMSEQ